MAGLKAFRARLREVVDPDDTTWTFTVPNLPSTQQTNAAGLIKFVSVVSSSSKQHIELRYDAPPSNRVTRAESFDKLMLISFSDFRLQWTSATAEDKPRMATMKENGDYITRLLTTGLTLNGTQYRFFGHSNSQLKSRSCFLFAGSKEDISRKIEAMGDLSKLKSVGKKAKRIGLLFSSAEMALELSPDRCEDIDDVKLNDYIFTDGCGLISRHLANRLCQSRNIVYRGMRYHPSVFQIRYRGYKGVLTVDPSLQGQIQVQFRESMRKFKDAADLSFSVVDYSKPYSFGHLNDEVIVLLHTLGISQDVLLSKQKQHLDWLQNVGKGDVRATFQFLSFMNRMDLAEKLLFKGIEAVSSTTQGLVRQEFSRMLNKRDEQRCRVLIPKSRLLFGICDPSSKQGHPGELREGECYVRITLDGDGKAHTIINTEVLVTRNPCLHPGDLQKFKAVDIPEFSHLTDCIIFPTRGKRPSADLMSGGDLDGDKFFVTWDPDIIPRTISEPAAYPGVKEPPAFKSISDDDRAEYFARYANASLGRVKNLYLKWAHLGNAMSPQCQQLNRLFSQCVDGNRIRIPQELEDPPEPCASAPPFILDVLHAASTEFIEHATNFSCNVDHDQDLGLMESLLSRDKLAVSEFELFQLALRWCRPYSHDIMQFAHLFDFSALSDEEQLWVLSSLPPSAEVPSLVRNGLLQSQLISAEELRRFGLDHAKLHWKPVFNSSADRMGRFISTACRSLELFHKKLIVLSVDERLTLAIYVPSKIPRASEVQVDSNVRVFALPRSQGAQSPGYRVKPTKADYRLYCDESAFQLYEKKRANTWIFLNRSQFNDTSYRNVKSEGDRRRQKEDTVVEGTNFDCRISVALQKIGADIQRHVGRLNRAGVLGAEVYVISNRDVRSMSFLDQWLQYVDTEEILPLFEQLEVEYKIPTLDAVDWDLYPLNVTAVVRDRNLSQLRRVDSLADMQTIFDLLISHEEKMFLRDVYAEVLSVEASGPCLVNRQKLVSTLLNSLQDATYLIPLFLQSQSWRSHKSALEYELVILAPTLLSSLVLATNELQGFIRQSFAYLLLDLKQITLQNFSQLVELIALTVRSPENALDLLLEILEPETSRLLVGRPLAVRQFVKCLFGIALDHVDEAASNRKAEKESLRLCVDDRKDEYTIVKCSLRIDSNMGGILKVGDHVRLTVSNPPQNSPLKRPVSLDALVLKAEPGSATFRCLHAPPTYVEDCAWNITHCGSFVTSKTMIDAVTAFYTQREVCCRIYALLAGFPDGDQIELPGVELPVTPDPSLNTSQNAALDAAMKHSLTFIWGPPGTGKTHTVVVILTQLLDALPQSRFLVTSPTHNAVDNLLRRFIADRGKEKSGVNPLRVATQFSKVSSDLKEYTCDAMVGKDLSNNFPARRAAQKRIKEARLIFTTCAGAGLGLLRTESFGVVLVDEASQQTEPATLIPLVKGCSRAILVGDHVQLRATVQKNAILTGFDVSLFERHYNMPERQGVAKVMLDTQYCMHRSICEFSSTEFYEGKLKTAVADHARPIPPSQFPWPDADDKRLVWIECTTPEDLGRQSKANAGQVDICRRTVQLLITPPPGSTAPSVSSDKPTMAILTPYNRQKDLLQSALPSCEVASIDGFQGREADIIIFVTVRSNVHGEMGFLTDMRRLNVVMTRAKVGVVVIGDSRTLTGGVGTLRSEEERKNGERTENEESHGVWKRMVERCVVLKELPDLEGAGRA